MPVNQLRLAPLTPFRSHELAVGRTAFDVDPSINPFQPSPRLSPTHDPSVKPAAGIRVAAGHLADCSDTMQDLARWSARFKRPGGSVFVA